jgi:hypothetical protein
VSHHSGSCHCGKVQFEVDVDLDQLMTCNCSICGVRAFGWGTGPDGSEMAMINARSLDGVDVHALKVAHTCDGRSL